MKMRAEEGDRVEVVENNNLHTFDELLEALRASEKAIVVNKNKRNGIIIIHYIGKTHIIPMKIKVIEED